MRTPEERRAYQREWKKNNAERVKELNRAYVKRARAKNPARLAANVARWKVRHPEKAEACRKRHELKRMYGLGYEQYLAMRAEQREACAICGTVGDLSVDHCHNTQTVRGLLCQKCNFGIGLFKDSPALLSKAAMYLAERQVVGEVG